MLGTIRRRRHVAAALVLSSLTACGALDSLSSGGFGATTGGVKDLRFARSEVEGGRIPPHEALFVEGAFAEHDLPLPPRACETTLCVNAAGGIAPTLDGTRAGWVQVGLSSNIDVANYERAPIAAVMVVDVSGSMGWGREFDSAGELARKLLLGLDERLHADDRVAIVAYGSNVRTVLEPTHGGDPAIGQAIRSLGTNGSTNMEAGLTRGYDIARTLLAEGRPVRLFLFTDENPNVGATEASHFENMVRDGASEGIGLTTFGLGSYVDPVRLAATAHLRLANAFTATLDEHVDEIFEESWPWMAAPIATDLSLKIAASEGVTIGETFGIPSGTMPNEVETRIGTVFLSKKRGAMLLRFDLPESLTTAAEATATLSYVDAEGLTRTESLVATLPAEASEAFTFDAPAVDRTTALAVLFSGLREAVRRFEIDIEDGLQHARLVLARAESDDSRLGDDDFTTEVDFARELVSLMERSVTRN